MISDFALQMSTAQVLTATANSTDLVDTLAAHNPGAGGEVLRAILQVSAASGTTPTLAVNWVGADDIGFSVNKATMSTISGVVAAGVYRFPVPQVAKRFWRLEYTIGGTTPSFTCTFLAVAEDHYSLTP